MNKFKEVKQVLSPYLVVQKYLGLPDKCNSTGNWYKSPFRKEKTASFCVSDKGIHDFGDSNHYDIISFVTKYFNTTPLRALEILIDDFNIQLENNEYENKEIIKILKQQKEEERKVRETIKVWFYQTFNALCKQYHILLQEIEILQHTNHLEALTYLYDEQVKVEIILDEFIYADEHKIEKLYLGRREINC